MRAIFLFIGILGIGQSLFAEPSYCDPSKFNNLEIKYTGKKPSNLRIYRIGELTVAGMALGNSKVADVVALAQSYSNAGAADKYCTWYLNDGNSEAQKTFEWHYVPRPTGNDFKGMGDIYMKALGQQLDSSAPNFVSCAINSGYIGMGCDGMKHRGPTVFAMLLAYSGCTPDHAAEIATKIWGNNGISTEMRSAIGKRAAEVAASHPALVEMLRSVMGN